MFYCVYDLFTLYSSESFALKNLKFSYFCRPPSEPLSDGWQCGDKMSGQNGKGLIVTRKFVQLLSLPFMQKHVLFLCDS